MQWNKEQIKYHKETAALLAKVKNEAFQYVKNNSNATEHKVQQFILRQFKKHDLKTNHITPIVAFRENTSFVHYHPSQYSKKLKQETLVMLDIWARKSKGNAPFADATFVAYKGKKIPKEVLKIFRIVIGARDKAIKFIKDNLKERKIPTGKEVDSIARNYIKKQGYGKNFLHGTGHSLGFTSPHGNGVRLNQKNKKSLSANIGYTIEPGIYLKNQFGVRSEIDFYINENYEMIITSEVQKGIIIL